MHFISFLQLPVSYAVSGVGPRNEVGVKLFFFRFHFREVFKSVVLISAIHFAVKSEKKKKKKKEEEEEEEKR